MCVRPIKLAVVTEAKIVIGCESYGFINEAKNGLNNNLTL